MRAIAVGLALGAVFLSGCAHRPVTVEITEQGLIDCFTAGTLDEKGKPASCETSAIAVTGQAILIATDKAPPSPYSQVLSLASADLIHGVVATASVHHVDAGWLREIRKIEEMSVAAEGDLLFVTTDFDWPPEPGNSEPDRYNVLVAADPANLNDAQIVAPSTNLGVTSSVKLRAAFQHALANANFPEGPPYFKLEGLTALPNRRMIFGIRETGASYENPTYGMTLLSGGYTLTGGEVALEDGLVVERVPVPVELSIVATKLGLSALAYDARRHGVWIVATIEGKEGVAPHSSYLFWKANGKEAKLMKSRSGEILKISFKVEGLAVLPDGSLLGVCDEDRFPSPVILDSGTEVRRPHQGVYIRLRASR